MTRTSRHHGKLYHRNCSGLVILATHQDLPVVCLPRFLDTPAPSCVVNQIARGTGTMACPRVSQRRGNMQNDRRIKGLTKMCVGVIPVGGRRAVEGGAGAFCHREMCSLSRLFLPC